jgi:rRNA-processing protein FCF1
MFDTNIFNHVLDGRIDIGSFNKRHHYYTTHIQDDEVCATKDPLRRANLKALFENTTHVTTESAVVGISRIDRSKISDGDLYKRLLGELNRLERKDNNPKDALIAETAIKNGHILVSDDHNLREATMKMGGRAISLGDFIQ